MYMLLKTSLRTLCAPCNFVLVVTLGGAGKHSPHCVPHYAPQGNNEKINVETNLHKAVFTRTTSVSSLLILKKIHVYLFLVFHC